MDFEKAHEAFIMHHLERRTGERRGRLERGHRYGEKLFLKNIWWPLRGNFDDLHPEYEVLDWRGRSYFADHAFIPGSMRLIIEFKGYETHVTNMDRKTYCKELNRELFLEAMGFRVISLAYDDVVEHPDLCIMLLRTLISRYEPNKQQPDMAVFEENEVIRFAVFLARPIRPIDVADHFNINHRTALGIIYRLCQKRWLAPIIRGDNKKVLQYQLTPEAMLAIDRW